MIDHLAIKRAYSDAVIINEKTGVFKEDGTEITLSLIHI